MHSQALDIIPGRFYFVWVKRVDSVRTSQIAAANICYTIDDELVGGAAGGRAWGVTTLGGRYVRARIAGSPHDASSLCWSPPPPPAGV